MIPGLREEMDEYLRRHPDDAGRLSLLLEQMDDDPRIGDRSNMRGHVVSSVMTLDRTRRRALLILHRAYGLWIPPGGHYEGTGTLYVSAKRERREETGLRHSAPVGGSPMLLDVDTHPIAPRADKDEGAHFHHDLMYLETIDVDFRPSLQVEEVAGGEWHDLDAIAAHGGRMARLVERIRMLPPSLLA